MTNEEIALIVQTIEDLFSSDVVLDPNNMSSGNIVDAICQLGLDIKWSAKHLGSGEAHMEGWGSIEGASKHIGDALNRIADSGQAIAEGLESISTAITLAGP
jgi:hypothetical protein